MATSTIKEDKLEQKLLHCDFCDATFTKKKSHTAHVKTHTGDKPFVCQFCAKSYKARSSLDGHILSKHASEVFNTSIVSYFKCKHCNARFISQSKLNQHQVKNKNDADKNLTCEHCSEKCSSTCAYKKHLPVHADLIEEKKPHACSVCQKRFLHKSDCNKHEKIHDASSNDAYPCGFCKKTFAFKYRVELHMKAKHKEKYLETFTPVEKKKKSVSNKLLHCDVCGKDFKTLIRLEEHSAIHTGNKQNLCEFCGDLFSKRSNLRAHLFTHTGVRPHPCSQCDQSFFTPGELKKHQLRHAAQVPCNQLDIKNKFTQPIGIVNRRKGSPTKNQPPIESTFEQTSEQINVNNFLQAWQAPPDVTFGAPIAHHPLDSFHQFQNK